MGRPSDPHNVIDPDYAERIKRAAESDIFREYMNALILRDERKRQRRARIFAAVAGFLLGSGIVLALYFTGVTS